MTVRVTTWWLMIATLNVALGSVEAAQETACQGTMTLNSIVEALEAQAKIPPRVSYQVIREYRLFGANNSNSNSEVVAEVDFRPPATKDYRIQMVSGSNRGQQVVRRILEHEVEAASNSNHTRTALNRENYDFTYVGETILQGESCYLLGLKPRRTEKDLISGKAWIDKHSFFVRQIEGVLAKTPSWWLKKVRVRLSFGDLGGSWLQTGMEAVADVRIVGPHTLTSRVVDFRGAAEVASNKSRMYSGVSIHTGSARSRSVVSTPAVILNP